MKEADLQPGCSGAFKVEGTKEQIHITAAAIQEAWKQRGSDNDAYLVIVWCENGIAFNYTYFVANTIPKEGLLQTILDAVLARHESFARPPLVTQPYIAKVTKEMVDDIERGVS